MRALIIVPGIWSSVFLISGPQAIGPYVTGVATGVNLSCWLVVFVLLQFGDIGK